MEFLLIWFLFGVVTAVVASGKGLNGCGWFVLGVLLGPFGFILSLVVPKNEAVLEKEALGEGKMKKCPHCAEMIKAEAVKCRYCGSSLISTAPPIVGNPTPDPKTNYSSPQPTQPLVPRSDIPDLAARFIHMSCRYCSGRIEFPDHGVGETLECPHCGKEIVLENPSAGSEAV